jgi:hypothetical protein
LKDRRKDYSWPGTRISQFHLVADKKSYSISDTIGANASFKITGGLREAFHPDIWTVAWEDFDKILRLTMKIGLTGQGGVRSRRLAETKKEVRKASFYWSRDPDLPYRIWAMIVPEDGGPPKIPRSVEDAKSKMLDVEKEFQVPASALGLGSHKLVADAKLKWGRRSFIDKGEVSTKSNTLVVQIE